MLSDRSTRMKLLEYNNNQKLQEINGREEEAAEDGVLEMRKEIEVRLVCHTMDAAR